MDCADSGMGLPLLVPRSLFGMFHGNLVQLPFASFSVGWRAILRGCQDWKPLGVHCHPFLNNGLSAAITR